MDTFFIAGLVIFGGVYWGFEFEFEFWGGGGELV
jgi:hypothetical protein